MDCSTVNAFFETLSCANAPANGVHGEACGISCSKPVSIYPMVHVLVPKPPLGPAAFQLSSAGGCAYYLHRCVVKPLHRPLQQSSGNFIYEACILNCKDTPGPTKPAMIFTGLPLSENEHLRTAPRFDGGEGPPPPQSSSMAI